jgi:hypothetical protein
MVLHCAVYIHGVHLIKMDHRLITFGCFIFGMIRFVNLENRYYWQEI